MTEGVRGDGFSWYPRAMTEIRGSAWLITGAGSGIGRAVAAEAALRGARRVVLTDREPDGLEGAAAEVTSRGAQAVTEVVDVTDVPRLRAVIEGVAGDEVGIDVLMNNAGHSLTGSFDEVPLEAFRKMIDVHLWGVVEGTHAVLPHLLGKNRGHIVNVSSVFGLIGFPFQAAYCTAKFAIRGFSESLRAELLARGSAVQVSSVHPGGVSTSIIDKGEVVGTGAGFTKDETKRFFARAARTTPAQAAQIICDGVAKDRPRILVGTDARILDAIQRTRPAGYAGVIDGQFRKALDKIRGQRQRP